MITVSNVSLQFGGDTLFKNVDLQFNAGNSSSPPPARSIFPRTSA